MVTFVCSSHTLSYLCFALHGVMRIHLIIQWEQICQNNQQTCWTPFSVVSVLFYSLSFLYFFNFIFLVNMFRFRHKKHLVKGGICKMWTEFKFKTLKKKKISNIINRVWKEQCLHYVLCCWAYLPASPNSLSSIVTAGKHMPAVSIIN